jgi:hypothetical protein
LKLVYHPQNRPISLLLVPTSSKMMSQSSKIKTGLCFLLFLLPFVILDDPRTQVIFSPKGSIRGAESKTRDVFQYSLRYAQPPVGQLRWRDPLPVNRWNGMSVLDLNISVSHSRNKSSLTFDVINFMGS